MFVPAGGFLLNAVQFGSGPRTFVSHGGWVGSWELWQLPFELMHTQWRCIGYDHRGSGASTCPPEAVTAKGLVDDLFAVLDHHDVASCVLAGESLGALTCLRAVLRDPSRFDGLVLVAGAPSATPEATAFLVNGSRAEYGQTVTRFVEACVPEPDSEHIRRWGRQILMRAEPEAAARMFEAHFDVDVVAHLADIAIPTLIIHGDNDVIVPLSVAESVASSIPSAELVVLSDTGHVPTLTRPREVVRTIERWARRL